MVVGMKKRQRERGREEQQQEVVEKVWETQPGDIPPAKGGLVGGGGESSASISIVLSIASATHFPTYARVHAREARPELVCPQSIPWNAAKDASASLPFPVSLPHPFRVIELYSILLHRKWKRSALPSNCR